MGLGRAARPIHIAIAFAKLGRMRGKAFILRHRHRPALHEVVQNGYKKLGAQLRESIVQAARSVFADKGIIRGVDRPGIKPAAYAHYGYARSGSGLPAFHNGALYGGRAAQARQKRGMHIDRRQAGHGKYGIGQNKAIGCHGQHIGLEGRQLGLGFCPFEAGGLVNGNAHVQRKFFHIRHGELLAAPRRTVRLRIHSNNMSTRPGRQPFQAGGRKAGSTHKDYTAVFFLSHFFTLLS